jgi:hypothetical protein
MVWSRDHEFVYMTGREKAFGQFAQHLFCKGGIDGVLTI